MNEVIPLAPERGSPDGNGPVPAGDRPLAAASGSGVVDRHRAEAAAAELLAALAVDVDRDGLRETPRRIVDVYAELLAPEPFQPTTFPNDGGYDELVVVSDIAFSSLCEHHLLPFTGVAHIGYLPGERIVGLSKLPRLVEHRARRLQVQERLTTQVANAVQAVLEPRGVAVVIEASHLCMMMRGVQKQRSETLTSCLLGEFQQPATRAEFMALVKPS